MINGTVIPELLKCFLWLKMKDNGIVRIRKFILSRRTDKALFKNFLHGSGGKRLGKCQF